MGKRTQVFLSYAHEDLPTVRKIYKGLKERDVEVWFDKEDLGPGRWKIKITKAIARSRFFVICISSAALRKTGDKTPGFQDEELNTAYQIAQEQSDQDFAIIPIRLEDCGRGDFRLSGFQQYDLFGDFEGGLDRLALHIGGCSLSDAKIKEALSEDAKIYDRLMGKAETYFYAGEIEKSSNLLETVTELFPDYAVTWHNKGVAFGTSGFYERALAAFDQALEIKPDYADAWYHKGITFHALDQHGEALDAFDQAIRIKPDYAQAWSNKGVYLRALGRNEEALSAYNEALKIEPDIAEAWYNKGILFLSLNRYEEGLTAFNRAINIKLDYTKAWNNKGVALGALNQGEEALAAFDQAIKIEPEFAGAWLNKGNALSALGRHEEACLALEKARSLRGEGK